MYLYSSQSEQDKILLENSLSSVPTKDCKITLPKGKGMFIGSFTEIGKMPADIAKQAKDAGLSWVAIQCVSQNIPKHPKKSTSSASSTNQ